MNGRGTLRKFVMAMSLGMVAFAGVPALAAPRDENLAVPDPQVDLLAMGDWAASSNTQRLVAGSMARYASNTGRAFSGVLLAGDNFYVNLHDIYDTQWDKLFEDMYDPGLMDFPFYPVLGNHDYGAGKDQIEMDYAVEHPDSRWKFPARWYRLDLPSPQRPLVTVLMLDSNKDTLGPTRWSQEYQWLESQLAQPRGATWTVCVAHHPLFSNGAHGDNGVLQTTWGALLKKYGVNFYMCGHDHDLQHLQIEGWPASFLLVGGGGANVRAMLRDNRGPFSWSMNGFAHLSFTPARAVVRFLDKNGDEAHVFERDAGRNGAVRVVYTRGVQRATSKTLSVIQGLDGQEKPAKGTAAHGGEG